MQVINIFRFFLSILIVIGHTRYMGDSLFLQIIAKIMLVSVGYFFFLSGYGLSYSFANKPLYDDKFLINKALSFISLTLPVYIFQALIFFFLDIKPLSTEPILDYLYSINWYLLELYFFYILFFILFKFYFKQIELLTWITCFSMIIFLPLTDIPPQYYFSCCGFALGVSIYKHGDKLLSIRDDSIIPYILVLVSGLLASMVGLSFPQRSIIAAIGKNIVVVSFCLFLFMVIRNNNDTVINSKLLFYLNSISSGIYIYQFPIIKALRNYWDIHGIKYSFFSITVVVATAIVASVDRVVKIGIITIYEKRYKTNID
ncbi:acyltransferase family protein [Butyrivibrio sp. FCS006]|uniref:acyltransferase family protein n=1 Tax=Butyrivibrio sp. FCS006 TaxID=1280684 RepID=UPI00210121BB|nr:acyltransferase family protein [Butyrivibrio sp. FCS006]